MQLRNFAAGTQKGYIAAVAGLAKYYRQSPETIGPKQIQDYVLYLFRESKLATGSCHCIFTGLRFFYTVTLGRDSSSIPLPPTKKITTLPEILSVEEIERLFSVTQNPKHRVMLMAAYSGGLRVSELVKLKITDIHSDRMMIRVDQGKGRKDRYTLLSKRLLEELRSYWIINKPQVWLFPGRSNDRPGSCRMAQKNISQSYQKSRNKAARRYSYITPLLCHTSSGIG